MPRLHPRKGFTLVELLVVVGILAVLIALLMPALSRARQSANQAACQGNLHQLTVALFAYVQNNDDWMIPAQWKRWQNGQGSAPPLDPATQFKYPTNSAGSYWDIFPSDCVLLGQYTDPQNGANYNPIAKVYQTFGHVTTPSSIWCCPEAYDHNIVQGTFITSNYALDITAYPTIGVDGPTPGAAPPGSPPSVPNGPAGMWKLSQVKHPCLMLCFVESTSDVFWPGYANPNNYYGNTDWGSSSNFTVGQPGSVYDHTIHHPGNSTNCSFLDGHVESIHNSPYGGVLSMHQAEIDGDFVEFNYQ